MEAVPLNKPAGKPDLIRLLASGRLVANGTSPVGETVWAGETYPAGFNFKARSFGTNYVTLMGEATFSRDNPIETHRIVRPGMTVATTGKRKHWALEFGKETVGKAKSAGVPVVVEALGFGRHVKRPKGQPRNRKANRMRHNFCYAHILRAILQEAARQGVGVIQVNPAYSSILGRKYARIYRWEIHLGAAMVIGRRGMGMSERQTFQFTVTTPKPRWQQRVTGKRSASNAKPAGSVRNTGRGSATVNPNHRLVELTDRSLLRLAAGCGIRVPGRRPRPGLSPGCQIAGEADSGGKLRGCRPKPKEKHPNAVADDLAGKAVIVHSRAATP